MAKDEISEEGDFDRRSNGGRRKEESLVVYEWNPGRKRVRPIPESHDHRISEVPVREWPFDALDQEVPLSSLLVEEVSLVSPVVDDLVPLVKPSH